MHYVAMHVYVYVEGAIAFPKRGIWITAHEQFPCCVQYVFQKILCIIYAVSSSFAEATNCIHYPPLLDTPLAKSIVLSPLPLPPPHIAELTIVMG